MHYPMREEKGRVRRRQKGTRLILFEGTRTLLWEWTHSHGNGINLSILMVCHHTVKSHLLGLLQQYRTKSSFQHMNLEGHIQTIYLDWCWRLLKNWLFLLIPPATFPHYLSILSSSNKCAPCFDQSTFCFPSPSCSSLSPDLPSDLLFFKIHFEHHVLVELSLLPTWLSWIQLVLPCALLSGSLCTLLVPLHTCSYTWTL